MLMEILQDRERLIWKKVEKGKGSKTWRMGRGIGLRVDVKENMCMLDVGEFRDTVMKR